MTILEVHNLKKSLYDEIWWQSGAGTAKYPVLGRGRRVCRDYGRKSGSGKTTLLNILAALDRPTEGEVLLNREKPL